MCHSASKAAADLLIKSWYKTYDFPSIIIHPTNNYGPWQFQKNLPLSILKLLTNKKNFYLWRWKEYKRMDFCGRLC